MSVLNEINARGHERVSIFKDKDVGLLAIIAIHNTVIGPGLGGCRLRQYKTLEEALLDVLKLSEGMTYKNALCGINFGGGKSVIIANNVNVENRKDLFLRFGECVNALNGKYVTAEDMGTSVEDLTIVAQKTQHVAGRDAVSGGGGDPSPWTALGVFEGMKAALERAFSSIEFTGRKVAIQGVGHVGFCLGELLNKAGAKVYVSDPKEANLEKAIKGFGATVVPIDAITALECDIFAPCAVGGTVNLSTAGEFKCRIIAGSANNQLGESETEKILLERGIMYVPDFAINAGGVILCASEFEPEGFSDAWVRDRVLGIKKTVSDILDETETKGEPPSQVALSLAKARIESKKKARL